MYLTRAGFVVAQKSKSSLRTLAFYCYIYILFSAPHFGQKLKGSLPSCPQVSHFASKMTGFFFPHFAQKLSPFTAPHSQFHLLSSFTLALVGDFLPQEEQNVSILSFPHWHFQLFGFASDGWAIELIKNFEQKKEQRNNFALQ